MNIIEFHSRTPVQDIRDTAWRNFREGRLAFPLSIIAFGGTIKTTKRAYRGNELLAFWDTLWRADSNHFPLSKIANLYTITDAFGHAELTRPETQSSSSRPISVPTRRWRSISKMIGVFVNSPSIG